MIEQLQAALADRYHVTGEIGGGGMSRVFDAIDPGLDRRVAIKVLSPELTAEIEAERFRREVQVVARLQHPHIVSVLAAGSGRGILWFAMPFVEGETVRARLGREGALPVGETIRIWRELLDALQYAHEHGIVHRDIKPENLMLSARHLLVADFGIARALVQSDSSSRLTQSGLLIGTPAYMAPEQAAGDSLVDHRADLYSSALVAYEMLTGRPPFIASTPQRLMAAHATELPPPIQSLRPAVPDDLAHLIHWCLEKDPADRPQSAAEVMSGLDPIGITVTTPPRLTSSTNISASKPRLERRQWRRVAFGVVGAAVVLIATAVVVVPWLRSRDVGPPTAVISRELIEVADFDAINYDPVVALAVTEAVRSEIGRSEVVSTPDAGARASMRQYAAFYVPAIRDGRYGPSEVREVAQRGALKAFVRGTINRIGTRLLVEASLVDPSNDQVLGTARAEAADSSQLLAAVQSVARELRAVAERVTPGMPTPPYVGFATTTSRTAFQLWASANQVRSEGDWLSPALAYREALRLDSTFAMAARNLAATLYNLGLGDGEAANALELARRHSGGLPPVERDAIETTLLYLRRDQRGLEAMSRQQRGGNLSHNMLGLALRDQGRTDEAIREFGLALKQFPASETVRGNLIGLLASADRRTALDSVLRADSSILASGSSLTQATVAKYRASLRDNISNGNEGYEAILAQNRSRGTRAEYVAAGAIRSEMINRGRLKEARRYSAVVDTVLQALVLPGDRLARVIRDRVSEARLVGDTARAAAELDIILSTSGREHWHPLDRKHAVAAVAFASFGDVRRARRELTEHRRVVAATYRNKDSSDVVMAEALIATLEGRWEDALRLAAVRESGAVSRGCYGCTLPVVARAYERAGKPDSAIAVLERFTGKLRPMQYWNESELPIAFKRLGELYESRGNRVVAVAAYQRFVDLWENADPEFQPAVQQVRVRIRSLSPPG